MTYEVYKIQNKVNNKIYIGITNSGYKTRFRKHVSEMLHGSTFILHNAMRKHGVINFTSVLLETVDTIEDLKLREQYWIKVLDTTNRDNGYNMTLGGDGTFGRLHSQETKDKIADKAKGRKNTQLSKSVAITDLLTGITSEYTTMSDANKALGKANGYLTWLSKSRNSNIIELDGFIITIGDRVVITKPAKSSTPVNLEHIQRIQKLALQARQDNFEAYKSSQRQAKLETGKTKIVQQFTLEGDLVAEHLGTREAAKAVNGLRAPIKNCIKGTTKKSYGYVWKYKQ